MGISWGCTISSLWMGRAPIASLQLCSNRMPLGSSVGPFAQNTLHTRLSKGHTSLWSMPAWRPLMPIQRPTPQVAAAVAAGALVLSALYTLVQSFNIQFQHVGSLQCLLVSLSGLLEGLIMWVISPPGPGSGFCLVDGLGVVMAAPHWSSFNMVVPPTCTSSSSGRTGCPLWPLPSIRTCRAVSQATFLVNILHGKGP